MKPSLLLILPLKTWEEIQRLLSDEKNVAQRGECFALEGRDSLRSSSSWPHHLLPRLLRKRRRVKVKGCWRSSCRPKSGSCCSWRRRWRPAKVQVEHTGSIFYSTSSLLQTLCSSIKSQCLSLYNKGCNSSTCLVCSRPILFFLHLFCLDNKSSCVLGIKSMFCIVVTITVTTLNILYIISVTCFLYVCGFYFWEIAS